MRTLDLEECAEFLKVNRATALELAGKGELPGAKIGRAWVFLEDDLVEYLRVKVKQQQRERQGNQDPTDTVETSLPPLLARRQILSGRKKSPELLSQV